MIGMRGIVLAAVLLGSTLTKAHATDVTVQPTDVWVKVDPPQAQYIRVHLNVHSISLVACSAQELNPVTRTPLSANPFGIDEEGSDKDGTLILEGAYPTGIKPATHWVKVRCEYSAPDSATVVQAFYTTSYVVPAKKPAIVPPPNLRVWVDPTSGNLQTYMSLYAKTDPGTLCSAYFVEGDAWYPANAVRVGKSGIAQWHWTYQADGTSYVTCDGHKQYVRGQADY